MTATHEPEATEAAAQLEELEAAAHGAEDDVRAARAQLDDVRNRLADLRGERLRLHREEPDQFTKEGLPKPKSRAAEVVSEAERLSKADLGPVIAGAEERAQRARRAIEEFKAANPVALAEALKPHAEAAVADVRGHLEGLAHAIDTYFTVAQRASKLLEPVSGLDGSDLPNADRLSDVKRFVRRELGEVIPLPLPRSLVPQEGFPSRKVFSATGQGWVGIQHASREDLENAGIEPAATARSAA